MKGRQNNGRVLGIIREDGLKCKRGGLQTSPGRFIRRRSQQSGGCFVVVGATPQASRFAGGSVPLDLDAARVSNKFNLGFR